jgi:cell division protease FtsH
LKFIKNFSVYIVILVGVILLAVVLQSMTGAPNMSYSSFLEQLSGDNVKSIKAEGNSASVVLKEAVDGKTAYQVKFYSQELLEELIIQVQSEGKSVEYTADIKEVPFLVTIIPYILLAALVVIFILFLVGQSQGGNARVMNFGKSRARLYTSSKIKFEDVAGADEEKEETAELVSFLKDPRKYADLGARIPKGVLMVGPPGTGKTYLAKAVAGEAGVPFFSISGSDLVEMYVGVGASRVRDLFEQAKKNAPCIIFIDEIDAVGRHRGAGLGGGHDEREQTLNQLLVEMDGFAGKEGIIIIAATNRPDILDPALTRPGRFDRKIVVNAPTLKAREEILKVHARNKPLSPEVSLAEVAKITPGFTPADLENLLNEAALLTARDSLTEIGMKQIKEATFRVIIGPEKKSHVMSEKDKRLTAIHETGHAIAVKCASTTDKVDRVSIIPAGYAGGYTAHKPNEDDSYVTKNHLIENIIICLGGRAAEELCLNEISTGASSDLKQANSIAHSMVAKYGMSDKMPNMVFDEESNEVFIGRDFGHTRSYSEDTAALIDEEVKRIIDSAYTRVKEILTENMSKLLHIADVLMEKEKIEGEEFEALMAD